MIKDKRIKEDDHQIDEKLRGLRSNSRLSWHFPYISTWGEISRELIIALFPQIFIRRSFPKGVFLDLHTTRLDLQMFLFLLFTKKSIYKNIYIFLFVSDLHSSYWVPIPIPILIFYSYSISHSLPRSSLPLFN